MPWKVLKNTLQKMIFRGRKHGGPKTTDNYFKEITTALRLKDQFVSKFFLRPKKDACFCMIINLKNVNQFILHLQLKIERLEQLKYLQTNLMVKKDL